MIRNWLLLAVACGLAAFAGTRVSAQTPLAFEVASVKANPDPPVHRFSVLPGGRLIVTGHPLGSILRHAFGRDIPLVDVPRWAELEPFDITAKAAENVPVGTPEMMEMLRTLLQRRFGLQAHREMRQMPIYVLKTERTDRRLGPGLTPSEMNCSDFVIGRSEAPDRSADPRCAITSQSEPASHASYRLRGRSLTKLASDLQVFTDRPVRDATGMPGFFDVALRFTVRPVRPGDAVDAELTLFTALREQLGLRLEPTTAALEVLVIDALQRPTPD